MSPQRKIAIVNIRSFTIGRIVRHLSSHNKSQPLVRHCTGATLVTVNKRKLDENMVGAAGNLAGRGGGACVTKTVVASVAGWSRDWGPGQGCQAALLCCSQYPVCRISIDRLRHTGPVHTLCPAQHRDQSQGGESGQVGRPAAAVGCSLLSL